MFTTLTWNSYALAAKSNESDIIFYIIAFAFTLAVVVPLIAGCWWVLLVPNPGCWATRTTLAGGTVSLLVPAHRHNPLVGNGCEVEISISD